MLGTLAAAGGMPGASNSGPIQASSGPAQSGDAYSGGTQGNININTGGRSSMPTWGWALIAVAAVGTGVAAFKFWPKK